MLFFKELFMELLLHAGLSRPELLFYVTSRNAEPEPLGLKMAYLENIIVRQIKLN